jgi:phosphatidylglycerol:prolipoprotein diacylglycerol transferase
MTRRGYLWPAAFARKYSFDFTPRSHENHLAVRPILFEIPLPFGIRIPLHSYGLMIVIGFLLAAWISSRESRRRKMPDFIYDMGLAMLLSGLVGGRILYYIENYRDKYAAESFLEFFKIWKGGLVFYGGALAGYAGGLVYCLKKKLPIADCMDVAAPGVPVAMAFGRLGCFLNGCCYGSLCSPGFPLRVVFPPDSPAAAEQRDLGLLDPGATAALPVHPAQLYQAGHDFLIAGLLLWYLRRPDAPRGGGIPLLFVLYGIGRFFLEGLRGDNPPTFTGLTLSQNLSLLLIVGFGTVFLTLLLRAKRAPIGAEGILKKTR